MNENIANDNITELRRRWYNAMVTRRRSIHDDLMIIGVRPDFGRLEFESGQYTVLALGEWERRIDGVVAEWPPRKELKSPLVRRAYSISCRILDDAGNLAPCGTSDELEFFITLVSRPSDTPPMLTPRLFCLQEGDRLYVGERAHGTYTLRPVRATDTVVFLATGTGEAPHNAMITELLANGHTRPIVSVVCVRYRADLAYLDRHRQLEQRFSNYRYFTLTTREPWNLDPSHPEFVGKQYIQQFIANGELERRSGITLDPRRTQVYLCGNPAMIGIPHESSDGRLEYPQPTGVIEVLVRRGFQIARAGHAGTIHFEKYW